MSSIVSDLAPPIAEAGGELRSRLVQLARLAAGFHQRRLFVASIFLAIFAGDLVRPTDFDAWWHLKTGELIAGTGVVPGADPFSYTAAGQPWIAHEWLWELAAFWLTQLGGFRLVVLTSAVVVTATYGVLYRLLRQIGANELVSGTLVIWAFVLDIPSIGVRPREATGLFLAFYLNRLFLYRSGKMRHLWALPPVMALWVNLHGPFVLGLVVLGAFAAPGVGAWLLRRGMLPRHLLLVGGASVAATFLNPAGPKQLLYPFEYYVPSSNPSFAMVAEFQPPDFHDPLYLPFAASLFVFILLGAPRRGWPLTDVLLLIAFGAQALVSVRNVPLYALVAAPLLAGLLVERFPVVRELPPLRGNARRAALNWIFLACLVSLAVWLGGRPMVSARLQLGEEPTTASLPVAGAHYIEEHHLPGQVFNAQPWGGYLIYRWYPERRVFMDGRIDMYGSTVTREYLDVVGAKPGWRRVLDKYGVHTVLIEKDMALSSLLLADGTWERVFQGDVEDVFVRR